MAPPLLRGQFHDVRIRSRGYQPHWELPGATYFITYRVHDSLPLYVIDRLKQERRRLDKSADAHAAFLARIDAELDAGCGSAPFHDPALASIVAENLQYFAGSRYDLYAWCVMPNHVYVVVQPFEGESLAAIVHSWKSYTAHRSQRPTLWAREYYDRIVRDWRHLERVIAYVRGNPAKARLDKWPWVG
jgi:REP element-mobilizing transposase RayT